MNPLRRPSHDYEPCAWQGCSRRGLSPRLGVENNQDPQQKYAARRGVFEPPCHLICRCPFKCSGAMKYPPLRKLLENPPRPYGSDRLADRRHTAMASFGQAPARQADVGEIESVDRTRRIDRREAELNPRHGSRRKKINLAKSSSGGLPPLDGLCAFAKT